MKKRFLGLVLTSTCFISTLIFYCDKSSDFTKQKMNQHDQGEQCTYYDRIPDNEASLMPDNSCLFESQETSYELEPELNTLISKIIERDFPGYFRSELWSLNEYKDLVENFTPVQWAPLIKAVWLCDDPAVQPLTTKSSALALSAVTPNLAGNGYDASVTIYEVRKGESGMDSFPMYSEVAVASQQDNQSFLMGVNFSVFSGRLVAVVERHSLKASQLEKTHSKILVHSDKVFKSFFEFDSFFYPTTPQVCVGGSGDECQATFISLNMEKAPLTTGSTVFLEVRRGLGKFDPQAEKEIPFIFDAKNWTLAARSTFETGSATGSLTSRP